LTPSRQL